MLLCIVLSLLLHLLILALLMLVPESPDGSARHHRRTPRALHVLRPPAKKQPKPQEEKPKPPRNFGKTSPDVPETLPRDPDRIGNRNTEGASELVPDSSEKAPHMEGEERPEEVNPLDQERQDGDLASEQISPSEDTGRAKPNQIPPHPDQPQQPQDQQRTPEETDSTPRPPSDDGEPLRAESSAEPVPQPTQQPVIISETPSRGLEQGRGREADVKEERPASNPDLPQPALPAQETPDGKPVPQQPPAAEDEDPQPRPAARPGLSDAVAQLPDPTLPPPAQRSRPVYDPSLPSSAQPGFRTHERRSRSSGTFICGRHPSLSVEASPRGRYEAEVYRRIARSWYFECDEHRSALVPGTLTVSITLTKEGRIHNLQLLSRRGASVVQQSLTFKAIRQASLPPIPASVQKELGGSLLEMGIMFIYD